MTERTHGGDWAAYETEYGRLPLDFSANVSPLGVPESVHAAICAAATHADRYPDPRAGALCRALAAAEGAAEAQVLCGGGASDLIWRAAHAAHPRRALVTAPCFGEYEAALAAAGCMVERVALDDAFRLKEEVLTEIDDNLDIIFLCQPNNPSGVPLNPALLRRILERCRETGTRLVLDECFIDFMDAPEQYTVRPALGEFPCLVILRAFTKLYAMAGVRLGWALCADGAFLDEMRRAGPPWSVSCLAQAAGLAALGETDYAARVRALVSAERPRLRGALESLGMRVVPGEANFLLFQSTLPLAGALRARGILLRGCADFAGLDGTWYRVAVRTRAENDELIRALREVAAR